MKYKILIAAFILFCSFTGPSDPPEVGVSFNSFWRTKSVAIAGYTKINARYEWVAGAFDSGLHVPQYNGLPTGSRSGVWNADGAIAADTANHRLYLKSGGVWNLIGGAGSTPTLQQVLTAGSTLTTDNIIDINGNDFEIADGGTNRLIMHQTDGVTNLSSKSENSYIGLNDSYAALRGNDSLVLLQPSGEIRMRNLSYTLSTTGKKIMLRDTATGLVQNIDPALLGGSTALSSITAATGTNSIVNPAGSGQSWNWNSLVDSYGLHLGSSNTGSSGSTQSVLYVTNQGVNANSNQTTKAAYFQNAHSGTNSINVGIVAEATTGVNSYAAQFTASATGSQAFGVYSIVNGAATNNTAGYFNASGGTNNYSLIALSGNAGIGTSAPAKKLHTVGTVRHETLGTATGDTTTYKPMGIDANGDVFPMTYWPGGGGGGNVTKVGTPVNNQIGVWTGDGTIEGDADLTFDGTTQSIAGSTTTSTLRVGTMEQQSYGIGNSWIADNTYFDGAQFRARATGAGTLFYFFGAEGQFRTYTNVAAGSDLSATVGTYNQFKVNANSATVAMGGSIVNTANTYTGATLLANNAKVGISKSVYLGDISTTPTAYIHIKAGTATASSAPQKYTAGINMTTAEAGAVEYDGKDLFFTPTGTIRKVIPTIISSRSTGQTAAVASVATQTVGASDASFMVSSNILVTTSSAESFTTTVDYTDEGNTARTLTLNYSLLAGTIGVTIAAANGAVPYQGVPVQIRCKASTTITIATTGTFTGATYNVEGTIQKIQ